jgi:hypothetical protein
MGFCHGVSSLVKLDFLLGSNLVNDENRVLSLLFLFDIWKQMAILIMASLIHAGHQTDGLFISLAT